VRWRRSPLPPRPSRPSGRRQQAGFAIVAGAGVGAVLVVAALPRIRGHARDAAVAWWLTTFAWALRALAIMLLMQAVGMASPFPLALLRRRRGARVRRTRADGQGLAAPARLTAPPARAGYSPAAAVFGWWR
jgi:hypothetical protein